MKPLLTVEEARKLLNMSRRWIYNRLNDGTIPYVKFGSTKRIDPADLQAFIESCRIKKSGEKQPAKRPLQLKHIKL